MACREKQMFTKETVGGTLNIVFIFYWQMLVCQEAVSSDLASSLHKAKIRLALWLACGLTYCEYPLDVSICVLFEGT